MTRLDDVPKAADQIGLRRTLLGPGRVRELSQLRPRRVVADISACWTIIIAAWALAAWLDNVVTTVAAAIVVGNRYYALFIIGHDGLHRRLAADRNRNDLVCDLAVLGPIGVIARVNDANHLRHHQHLASEADPDRHRHGCFNKSTRGQLVTFLVGLSTVTRSLGNTYNDGSAGAGAVKEQRVPRDYVVILAWQITLCAGLTWAFGWWGYPLLWWAPVFVFSYLADNLRSFVEHSHVESDAEADEHRLVTHHPAWVERQLLAPMNMHCHAAHHLWPSIPYYNLPIADAELRATAGDSPKLTWRRSYLAYLLRYAKALPISGCPRPNRA